ncbi:thioredoxin-like protein [Jimgerdemannia flammicorona]|uniref:Thioredoxin-like protein n=1 Tax=Jimgerdemannia flammicorona TaxID=994334 RepID=A0A433QBP0_9FUNG|nr:thioredoxin-like protein [Jimgerdemannia flammicorona]
MSSILKTQLSKSIKEIRLHYCQTSTASNGVREFITENYTAIKQANPNLPILIREASGVEARAFARYVEKKAVLNNLPPKDVEKALEELMKS